jgi:hypothetical protein
VAGVLCSQRRIEWHLLWSSHSRVCRFGNLIPDAMALLKAARATADRREPIDTGQRMNSPCGFEPPSGIASLLVDMVLELAMNSLPLSS